MSDPSPEGATQAPEPVDSADAVVEPTPDTLTDEQVRDNAATRIDQLLSGPSGDESSGPDETGEETDETDAPETNTEAEQTDDQTDDTEKSTADTEAAGDDSSPTLPAAHIRTLKSEGWTDEEISKGIEVNPERVMSFAADRHKARNVELASWAKLGRERKEQGTQEQSQTTGEQPAQPAQPTPAPGALQPLDEAAFKEEFGDNERVTQLVTTVNTAIAQLGTLVPQAQAAHARVQQMEQETITRQINGFFESEDLKPFDQLYGAGSTVSEDQQAQRANVLQTADALIIGAEAQGRQLNANEAMTLAHEMVTADTKESLIRDNLKATATKHKKSFTLKPKGAAAPEQSGPLSQDDIYRNAAERIQKLAAS